MVKKILAVLVCAAVVLSFAGCGSENAPAANSSGAQASSTGGMTGNENSSAADSGEVDNTSSSSESEAFSDISGIDDAWKDIPEEPEYLFETEEVDGGVAIKKYNGFSKKVNIPAKIGGKDVVELGGLVFSNYSDLQDVKVPESVRKIDYNAFYYRIKTNYGIDYLPTPFLKNKRLENPLVIINNILVDGQACQGGVTIPEGVKSINERAFFRADISSIHIPESVTSIGYQAFEGCKNLKSVNLPEGLTLIDNSTFEQCSELSDIKIPKSVNIIGDEAFLGCSKLAAPSLPNGLTVIGNGAFVLCNFTSIDIPDSVTSIGEGAFRSCPELESIKLPDGVTEIKKCTFERCPKLTQIDIPDSVTIIESGAFLQCTSLKSIRLPKSLTKIGNAAIGQGAFCECTSLESIVIPEGVTEIGHKTFYDCTSLAQIDLPSSLTKVGESAFSTRKLYENYPDTIITYKGGTYVATGGPGQSYESIRTVFPDS